jgi:uncharacterized protein (TIGR03067 family)
VRPTRILLLLVLFVTVAFAAPVPKSLKRPTDARAILGRWQGDTLPARAGAEPNYTFRFSDDGTCGITNRGPNARESGATYALLPDDKPRRMTWWNGPERTEWRCVYELDGDTLRVGFVHQGTAIPDTVQPSPGLTVYELKRAADDK